MSPASLPLSAEVRTATEPLLLAIYLQSPLSTEVQARLWTYEVNPEVSTQAFFSHGHHGDGKILCSGGIMGI